MWFCSSGLAPIPLAGATVWTNGNQLVCAQVPPTTPVHTSNGLAAVAIKPNQNSETTPITASAVRPSRSPLDSERDTK